MQGETDRKPTLLPGQAREDVGFCRLEVVSRIDQSRGWAERRG
jgi:hypothetical protein